MPSRSNDPSTVAKQLIDAGKVRHFGLSEAGVSTIRRADAGPSTVVRAT